MMKELNFVCEACGLPMENNDGALCMKGSELQAATGQIIAQEDKDRHKDFLTGKDLAEWGPISRAIWRSFHYGCVDMNEKASAYQIELERMQTHREMLVWTAHLMQKTWIRFTAWEIVITDQVGYDV
jgi:hypothetical protein